MIIKSKGIKSAVAVLLVLLFPYLITMFDLTKNILFSLILFFIFGTILLLIWFIYDKTIIMDKSGVTICFLFYKKSYSWNDVKMIKIVNLKRCYEFGRLFHRCAYFSFKRSNKLKSINPSIYGCFHPFSFCFIYLEKGARIYEFDEQLFKSKLNEWGIRFEQLID